MEVVANEFFQGLFTAQEDLEPELICRYVPQSVTSEMNEMLCFFIKGVFIFPVFQLQ